MFVSQAFAAGDATEGTNTETGVAGGGDHGGGAFPPFDQSTFASQLLWLAITFGLFYLFMQKVIVPRIGGILENRRDRIAQDLDEANRLKTEADAAIAAYEQDLADARAKAQGIAQTARDNAKTEAEAQRAKVEAGLAEKTEAAEKRIADIKTAALGEIDKIAGDTTAAIVEQLIGAKVPAGEVATAIKSAGGK